MTAFAAPTLRALDGDLPACAHTFTCRVCHHDFHTIGGGNWPEPARSTCGTCLLDPEPGPPQTT